MRKSTKVKIIRIALLVITVTLTGRVPMAGDEFPVAIGAVAWLSSINAGYMLLSLPIAAGVLPYLHTGIDPCCSLISTGVCGIVFAISCKCDIQMMTWQKSVIANSIHITTMCIYYFVNLETYRIISENLILQILVITAVIYMTENLYKCFVHEKHERQITLSAFCAVLLLMICGLGLEFAIWPAAVFISVWATTTMSTGLAVQMTVTASIIAAFVGQPEWGGLITLIMSIYISSLCKKNAMLLKCVLFAITAIALQSVESGVILGIDNYIVFTGCGMYVLILGRYEKYLKSIMKKFGDDGYGPRSEEKDISKQKIKKCAEEFGELSALYGTYLDSRSVLSHQFSVMEQILDAMNVKPLNNMGKINVDIALSQQAATGNICGDCCGWDDIGNNKFALIISDGMGKGKRAAAESLLVVRTMLTLLKCGASAESVLKLINTIMMIKDDMDSFATVDLILIDKVKARAKFYKIGAAPTLIRRKDGIEEVMLSAIPLGMVNGLRINFVETRLQPGELILMMSDGISDGPDGKGALEEIKEIIEQVQSTDVQDVCDLVMRKSIDSYIGKERDDLTVMAARIF